MLQASQRSYCMFQSVPFGFDFGSGVRGVTFLTPHNRCDSRDIREIPRRYRLLVSRFL